MIWESSYWKDELLRLAKDMDRRTRQTRWRDASLAKVERNVMVGFYLVRKLMDASKVSDDVASAKISLASFAATGRNVHRFNWDRIDHLYDLAEARKTTRDLRFVCNQMVHSYVFSVMMDDNNGLGGLRFASDHAKDRELFLITTADIIRIFEQVGSSYPCVMSASWNPETRDYDVSNHDGPGDPSDPGWWTGTPPVQPNRETDL